MVGEETGRAEVIYYNSISEKDVEWLWYPYIPYGKLTLLQGDPGDGKSTFMLHLAATVTNGGTLPDGTKMDGSHTVIYQCSEDNPSDTIKPRLTAAGADCSKVAFIPEEKTRLTVDDPRIEDGIRSSGARLVIFDPLQAYLSPVTDMTSAARMRQILNRLSDIAEKYRCAIVLIGHMTKSGGGKKLYRGLGSIDIAATARSVLMIARDEEVPNIRYMFPVKSSLAYEGKAVRFMFDREFGFQILGICDREKERGSFSEEEDCKGKARKAERLMRVLLSRGSMPSKKVLDQMTQIGVSERTARTVMKNLGVKAFRSGTVWFWKMDTEAQAVMAEGR